MEIYGQNGQIDQSSVSQNNADYIQRQQDAREQARQSLDEQLLQARRETATNGQEDATVYGQRPRGNISFFASDGHGRISRSEGTDENGNLIVRDYLMNSPGAMLERAHADQAASFNEYAGVVDAMKKKQAKQIVDVQNSTASLMRLAGGGQVPPAAIALFNRKFAGDGRTGGLLGAGFNAGGDFVMEFAQPDANGNVRRVQQVANPLMQYQMMNQQSGIFSDQDRAAMRTRLKDNFGYSEGELGNIDAVFQKQVDVEKQYKIRASELRVKLLEQKLAKSLGQSDLTPAQKYGLYHFNEFSTSTSHKATEEDVTKGIAKHIGDDVWTLVSPEQAFRKAVEFYNNANKNADPAVAPDPDKGGGGPKVIKTATADPTSAGSEAIPAGGETSAVGNLSHEGRKWKFYTDADGKINGYGTTRSTYTRTDDGKFAVIPTIVDGEELSEEDAVAHYNETGENWGVVGSEEEAKKLAQKIHLEEQSTNQKAWNDYIHENWDKMSSEITSDEGMIAEHERRLAEKNGVGQVEFDFGGTDGTDATEAQADGGEEPVNAGERSDASEGDEEMPDGEEDATSEMDEDGVSVHNPFAKWVRRSKKNRK